MTSLNDLRVKIFADGADLATMRDLYSKPFIKGFTTNPTLMRKAGVTDYRSFAKDVLAFIADRPISFEVFSDDLSEMMRQACEIASWGDNVYVKIPVMNTKGKSAAPLIRALARAGVKLNVTAVFTLTQVHEVCAALGGQAPAIVSVFAGRIADSGVDPIPLMAAARHLVDQYQGIELLWASSRELLNVFQADAVGCHIITATNDILKKLDCVGKNLHAFALETVKMFYNDALKAGFSLPHAEPTRQAA
jgi:transaldolase